MTKVEYLMQIGKLKTKIEKMQERIEEYRVLAQSPATASYSDVRVKGTPSGEAPFVKWVYKIIELEEKVAEMQNELQTLQARVITAIEQLDNEDYKMLLLLRYVQCFSWDAICRKMNIADSTAWRWNKLGIQMLKVDEVQ